MRRRRRLRRLPRCVPAEHPRRRAATFERDYPFAWLGILAGRSVDRGARLRAPRTRLRAALAAVAGALALLRAVPSGRRARRLAGRAHLGASAGAHRAGRLDAARGAGAREGDHGHAQLRRRADAARAAVPRRRRGAHRPADGREGAEPRDRGRARARRGDRRLVRERLDDRARLVLGRPACAASGAPSTSRGG